MSQAGNEEFLFHDDDVLSQGLTLEQKMATVEEAGAVLQGAEGHQADSERQA